MLNERAADTAQHAAEIASKASYLSAGGTLFMGLTLSDIGILIGIVCTLLTTTANFYFRLKHDRLELARAKRDGIKVD